MQIKPPNVVEDSCLCCVISWHNVAYYSCLLEIIKVCIYYTTITTVITMKNVVLTSWIKEETAVVEEFKGEWILVFSETIL